MLLLIRNFLRFVSTNHEQMFIRIPILKQIKANLIPFLFKQLHFINKYSIVSILNLVLIKSLSHSISPSTNITQDKLIIILQFLA